MQPPSRARGTPHRERGVRPHRERGVRLRPHRERGVRPIESEGYAPIESEVYAYAPIERESEVRAPPRSAPTLGSLLSSSALGQEVGPALVSSSWTEQIRRRAANDSVKERFNQPIRIIAARCPPFREAG
ncbi:hypothetical protein NQZ68_033559 [Dissostichus eleginoides]|nr:hypothetical protein NQZ68_033559 [Dissostichus eleginoides]